MPATQPSKPVVSRTIAFGVVGLAVLLSGLGLVLAVQQSRAVVMGRIADLRPEAQERVAAAQTAIAAEIDAALESIARGPGNNSDQRESGLPSWLGTVFVWDRSFGSGPGEPKPPQVIGPVGGGIDVDTLQRLVEGRLQPRVPSGEAVSGLLHDVLAGDPVVIAYRLAPAEEETADAVTAVLDLPKLRTERLAPRITGDGRLALVESTAKTTDKPPPSLGWSETFGPMFPFWAVQPSSEFIAAQQTAGRRQTLLYAGVTVLALFALLMAFGALNRMVEHEVMLSRMRSNFVADVSHELKTPLALIRMFGETLLEGRVTSTEKAKEYYAIITRESTRLTHLINNILDFARIDAGKKQYRTEPVDVGRVVRETYELYLHDLDHHGFRHECAIGQGLPEIGGDADAIGQVLLNLISNAIKYSTDEKYLGIDVAPETRRGKHGVLLSVRDRGIGIRPEDRVHLFDGFFRAGDERVRKRRGAGLGLALCKHIVDAHGGHIDVESRLVKGSTFRIFLPGRTTLAADEAGGVEQEAD